jgi:hypothetical protein
MSSGKVATVSCVAAVLASCSSPPGGAPAGLSGEQAVVQFSYAAVEPQTVRIAVDGSVTWMNIAQDTRGFVVFPASIASSFRCEDLHPYFSRTAAGYRSLPITAVESERVELPCALAPGTYDYEIWLMGAGFGTEFGAGEPERILRAKIVVE